MRRKISAGVLMALVLLVPAAPAAAQAAAPAAAAAAQTEKTPGLDAACQPVERKIYKDIRKLVTIDLDAASNVEIRVLANQILAAAKADSLPVLPRAIQERLDGTEDDLRAFLKKGMQSAWTVDLRISIARTMTNAGTNVKAAAQKALNNGTIDALLAYLNEDLYEARELDCASQPSASPGVTPSVTPGTTTTATPSAVPGAPEDEGGEGGGLPLTGSATGTVAAVGGVLLLLGGAAYLIGRRRQSRFVA